MTKELVNGPEHYSGTYVADVLDSYGFGPHLWQAGKYIMRAGKKDPDHEITDLRKAIWYLKRALEIPGHRFVTGPIVGELIWRFNRTERPTFIEIVSHLGIKGTRAKAIFCLLAVADGDERDQWHSISSCIEHLQHEIKELENG